MSSESSEKIYEPVGYCIFCAGDSVAYDLTDEHIIAYSLGGNIILRKATCKKHQRVTQEIDEYIALKTLKIFRHSHGLPSRTKSGWQPHYRISVLNECTGIKYFQEVPISEVPGVYVAPNLSVPGLLTGDISYPEKYELEVHFDGFEKLNSKFPPGATTSMESGEFQNTEFARMLAKVAHTYTSAELGHGNFEPLLLDVVEGTAPNPWMYVGGFSYKKSQDRDSLLLHAVCVNGVRYWIVSISIHALPKISCYQVVSGIVLDPMPYPQRTHASVKARRAEAKHQREVRAKALGIYGSVLKR